MRDRDQLGARAEQLFELGKMEIAFLVDWHPFEHRALALAQKMPRNDVGMVLHDRKHDFVARLDALTAERIGNQIDRLGGVASKDDFLAPPRVEESSHL